MKLIRLYNHYLESKPLLTKTISGCIIFGFGDYLCQKLENNYIFNLVKNKQTKGSDFPRKVKCFFRKKAKKGLYSLKKKVL